MTFNEIIRQALTHLEFNDDDDAVSAYNDRFMMDANDAVRIIADSLKLEQVDTVQLDNRHFHLSDLSKPLVTKICEVYIGRRQYLCVTGDTLDDFVVVGVDPNATVSVRYRWMPVDQTDGDAEPDIPAIFHPIIWFYIVHCHHNSRSTSSDYDRTKWLQEFERQRRIITRSYGAYQSYAWKNLPWHTGEI